MDTTIVVAVIGAVAAIAAAVIAKWHLEPLRRNKTRPSLSSP